MLLYGSYKSCTRECTAVQSAQLLDKMREQRDRVLKHESAECLEMRAWLKVNFNVLCELD